MREGRDSHCVVLEVARYVHFETTNWERGHGMK